MKRNFIVSFILLTSSQWILSASDQAPLSIDEKGEVTISESLHVPVIKGSLTIDDPATSNAIPTLELKGANPVLLLNTSKQNKSDEGYAELRFGNEKQYIRGELQGGMTFFDADQFLFKGSELNVEGETHLNGKTTIASGGLHITGDKGDLILTGLQGASRSMWNTATAKIEFGNGAGIEYHHVNERPKIIFPQKMGHIKDTLKLYGSSGDKAFVTMEKSYVGTHIASPIEDKWLHISSNGKAVTISNDGTPPESPNETAALHVDGKIAHGGMLKLSDRRLKTNIVQLEHSLERIVKLSGVQYNWERDASSENPRQESGLIAQEVEAIIPEAVSTSESGTRYMDYDALIPYLIEAIKEQQEAISSQQTKIEELERRIKNGEH